MLHRILLATFVALPCLAQDSAAIYKQRCASCHDTGANRAPAAATLKQMSPESAYATLTNGNMAVMALGLSTSELKALATHVTGKPFSDGGVSKAGYCADRQATTG